MSYFGLINFFVLFGIVFIIWKAIRGMFGKRGKTGSGDMVCQDCGSQCDPARKTRGSTLIEIACWLLLIVPGIIYSLWRVSSRLDVCPACGSDRLVPISTPIGKKLIDTYQTPTPSSPKPENSRTDTPKPKSRLADDQNIGINREGA